MAFIDSETVRELDYSAYQNRQLGEVSKDSVERNVEQLKVSDKFSYNDLQWSPCPYPGFAVVSMLTANPGNESLSRKLKEIQQLITSNDTLESSLYLLPQDSFHQTIANTLSAQRYQKHLVESGLVKDYPQMIASGFEAISLKPRSAAIAMRLVGVTPFGSSLGILGVFDNEDDFDTVITFRNQFYSNATLNKLTIKRTRPFIGHITLGYFGRALSEDEKAFLKEKINILNEQIVQADLSFKISNTQLRSYNELSYFHEEPTYPTFHFKL